MKRDILYLVPSRPQDTNPYNLVIVGVSCFSRLISGAKAEQFLVRKLAVI